MRGKRSTVVLFIRGLPADVSNKELKDFIRTTLNASGLKTKTMFSKLVGDCNILRLTDPETGQIEFHALIDIRPAALAMRAIDILNETKFRGSPLTTHRYRLRSLLKHRQGSASNANLDGTGNPRTEEQRRPTLKIDLVEPNFPGLFALRAFGANHWFTNR